MSDNAREVFDKLWVSMPGRAEYSDKHWGHLRDFFEDGYQAGLEAAAKVCDDESARLAAAIRKLKDQP